VRLKAIAFGVIALLLAAAPARAATRDVPSEPNDTAFPLQWNLQMVGAPDAWRVSTGANELIAVIDSGIDLGHPDLQAKIADHLDCVGKPCEGGPTAGQDDNGHGSHVAGIAAAATNNGEGVAGVAPDARLLVLKALAQSCDVQGCTASGTADDVARAITYAADHGAAVINLSLGNSTQAVLGAAFQDALDDAWSKGVIPVLAAGNDFLLPSGGINHALVVGAVDRDGQRAPYSNIGTSKWSISAPGGSGEGDDEASCRQKPQAVLSTYLNSSYACISGTSMAAPHVAAAAAMLRSLGYSPQEAVDRLLATARPAGPGTGVGILDIAAAVGEVATTSTSSPESSSSEAPATTATPGTSAPTGGTAGAGASSPTGDLAVPSPTMPDSVIPLPKSETAAPTPSGRVTVSTPASDDLPGGAVALAVLLAATVGGASGWQLVRSSTWARRTPPP
jgi:subtilisin family serine protease